MVVIHNSFYRNPLSWDGIGGYHKTRHRKDLNGHYHTDGTNLISPKFGRNDPSQWRITLKFDPDLGGHVS